MQAAVGAFEEPWCRAAARDVVACGGAEYF